MQHLFDNFTKAGKTKLLKSLEATAFTFPKNTDLSSMVYHYNTFGIIEYGSVQISKNDYNGNHIIIDDLKENDIFGSLLFPITHEHSVLTKEETRVTFIEYSRLMDSDISASGYLFMQNLLRLLLSKLNEKNDRIEILTKKMIRDKLLEYFNMLSRKTGSFVISLPFTFTELADYLAVDRSAMSREIKHLKTEGLIQVSNRKITLLYDM